MKLVLAAHHFFFVLVAVRMVVETLAASQPQEDNHPQAREEACLATAVNHVGKTRSIEPYPGKRGAPPIHGFPIEATHVPILECVSRGGA